MGEHEAIQADPTEALKREMVAGINSDPGSREALEAEHGQVWDTEQLTVDFTVEGFMAPFISVTEKKTGKHGTLMFQHSPRFYFSFTEN